MIVRWSSCAVAAALLLVLVVVVGPTGARGRLLDYCQLDLIQLPETFAPKHYDLTIEPNLDRLTFKGVVSIETEFVGPDLRCSSVGRRVGKIFGKLARNSPINCVLTPTLDYLERRAGGLGGGRGAAGPGDRIFLNVGPQLKLQSVQVFRFDAKSKRPFDNLAESLCLDTTSQVLAITLAERAKSGQKYSIEVHFSGKFGALGGLVKSGDAENLVVSSSFFPANARNVFPCFDEPKFKSVFRLTLKHHHRLAAISSAQPNSKHNELKRKQRSAKSELLETSFHRTPAISTVNFGFALARVDDTLKCRSRDDVALLLPESLLSRSSRENANSLLEVVCAAIEAGERYFGAKLPQERISVIVTNERRQIVRASWGMLFINEEEFLLASTVGHDPHRSDSIRSRLTQLIFKAILAQWWTNLVVPKWWDDQWLFDGFTSWQSHEMAARHSGELEQFEYLLKVQSPALDSHAHTSAAAIKTYQLLTANREVQLYDKEMANKATAIFRMLSSAINVHPTTSGKESMKATVVELIEQPGSRDVDSLDFAYSLGRSIGRNVEPMLRTWLDLRGFPLVGAKLVPNGIGPAAIELSQQRLLESTVKPDQSDRMKKWIIPVQYQVCDGAGQVVTEQLDFSQSSARLELPSWFDSNNPNHWVKLNTNFSGFYRVQYDEQLLRRLQTAIVCNQMTPVDRFNLVDDLRALLKDGRLDVAVAEEALQWFKQESSGGVLSGLAKLVRALTEAHEFLGEDSSRTNGLVISLFEHVFRESQSHEDRKLSLVDLDGREDALHALVAAGHQPTILKALEHFSKTSSQQVNHDDTDDARQLFPRKPAYLAALLHGNDEQFSRLLGILRGVRSSIERDSLFESLVSFAPSERSLDVVESLFND